MLERLAVLMLLLAAVASAGAAELQTLFHSPQERDRLDKLRRGEPLEAAAAPARRGPEVVTGFVKRSDGRNTIWIDGRPRVMSGSASAPLLDPAKVRESSRPPDAPPIEVKRSR